jgi:hypothetical protein
VPQGRPLTGGRPTNTCYAGDHNEWLWHNPVIGGVQFINAAATDNGFAYAFFTARGKTNLSIVEYDASPIPAGKASRRQTAHPRNRQASPEADPSRISWT